MHQNLAIILQHFNWSKNSFIVIIPEEWHQKGVIQRDQMAGLFGHLQQCKFARLQHGRLKILTNTNCTLNDDFEIFAEFRQIWSHWVQRLISQLVHGSLKKREEALKVHFLKKWSNPGLFLFIFILFSHYNFNTN